MKRKNLGITLISLIVIVIILLILAGITISSLTNVGLFERAKEARDKWKNAQEDEELLISKYNNEINNYVSGGRSYLNVKSGTYTGTGESGNTKPNTLIFDEAPQMITIMPTTRLENSVQTMLLIQGVNISGINTVSNTSLREWCK